MTIPLLTFRWLHDILFLLNFTWHIKGENIFDFFFFFNLLFQQGSPFNKSWSSTGPCKHKYNYIQLKMNSIECIIDTAKYYIVNKSTKQNKYSINKISWRSAVIQWILLIHGKRYWKTDWYSEEDEM